MERALPQHPLAEEGQLEGKSRKIGHRKSGNTRTADSNAPEERSNSKRIKNAS